MHIKFYWALSRNLPGLELRAPTSVPVVGAAVVLNLESLLFWMGPFEPVLLELFSVDLILRISRKRKSPTTIRRIERRVMMIMMIDSVLLIP